MKIQLSAIPEHNVQLLDITLKAWEMDELVDGKTITGVYAYPQAIIKIRKEEPNLQNENSPLRDKIRRVK